MKAICTQIVTAYVRSFYDLIMSFIYFYDSLFFNRELKHCYNIASNKLTGNRATNQIRIFFCAQSKILLYLRNSKFICTTFGLYWDYKLLSCLINTNINFIRFNLTDPRHCCAQVVLK